MNISEEDRVGIYNRGEGKCVYCHYPLVYKNYGVYNSRGGWHLDHKKPRAEGGTNDFNNLVAACIDCNLSKSAGSARSFRYQMRPSRLKRRKAAIVRDVDNVAPGLGLLLFLGAIDIRAWWQRRRERELGQIRTGVGVEQSTEENLDLPWLGMLSVLIFLCVVYSIVKSHKA